MKTPCYPMKLILSWWPLTGFLVALGWLVALGAPAQTNAPPLGTKSVNPLAVGLSLWPPEQDASFPAHAPIRAWK